MAAYMPEDFTEGDYYIGFASKKTYIDLVYGPQIVYQEHRIDIKGFTGENKGMVNYTQNFTIDVACLGTAGETAESYSIALMNGRRKHRQLHGRTYDIGRHEKLHLFVDPESRRRSIDLCTAYTRRCSDLDRHDYGICCRGKPDFYRYDRRFIDNGPSPNYKHYLYETLYTPEDLVGLQAGDVIETVISPITPQMQP